MEIRDRHGSATSCSPRRVELAREQAARVAAEVLNAHLRESEDRYHKANERLAAVIEGVDDGISMQDPSGRIVFANETAARLLGYASLYDLLSAPVTRILEPIEKASPLLEARKHELQVLVPPELRVDGDVARLARLDQGRARGRARRAGRSRQRHRHRTRDAAAHLRVLRAGAAVDRSLKRRARTGTGDRAQPGRAARRQRVRAQRRAGQGHRGLGPPPRARGRQGGRERGAAARVQHRGARSRASSIATWSSRSTSSSSSRRSRRRD